MRESTGSAQPSGAHSTGAVLAAEGFGTFVLVLGIISAALISADVSARAEGESFGVGFVGIALAAGFALIACWYVFGPVSGGHFNPAVTLGLAAAGRFPWQKVLGYVAVQVIGGIVATTIVVLIGVFGPEGWLTRAQDRGFASNGWGGHLSPGGFGMGAAVVVEVLFTAILVIVILGVTHPERGNRATAGLVVGLTLALVHLATLPVDYTSVNPARSIAAAIYGGTAALGQLWVFVLFPIAGALVAGVTYRALFDPKRA